MLLKELIYNVALPEGVTFSINKNDVKLSGPRGDLTRNFKHSMISISENSGEVKLTGKKLRLGRNYLKKNNVLVIEFNKYGIVKRKEFYNKEKMNKISFAKNETVNEIRKENFIHSFLSSVRQKMLTKRK